LVPVAGRLSSHNVRRLGRAETAGRPPNPAPPHHRPGGRLAYLAL